MAVCPHCGDTEAPLVGTCPACGENVAEGSDLTGDTVDFDDLEPATQVSPVPVIQPTYGGQAPDVPVIAPTYPGETDSLEFDDEDLPPTDVVEPIPVIDPSPPAGVPVIAPMPPAEEAPRPRAPRGRRGKRGDRGRGRRVIAPAPTQADAETEAIAPVPTVEPHAELTLNARYEFTSLPGDDPPLMGILLELDAVGRPLVARDAGPVAHVILALDLSASMNHDDKYPVLKAAVRSMLEDLQRTDAANVLVSVVIFSMGAEVLIKRVEARKIGVDAFFEALERNSLCFGPYTDIAGALSRAGRIAFDETKENKSLPVRLYLLTDGKPQDMPKAEGTAERLGKVAVDLHALAFGGDADVSMLQDLFAGKRGGTVKSVRRETIGSAFERVAEVAQKVVATRCRVAVDLAPGVVGGDAFRYRPARVRFPEPAFTAGKRFRADLGNVETGRTYSLLFEIRPQETEDRVSRLGTATVQIPGYGGPITETLDLTLTRTPAESEPGDIDNVVRTARDILGALTDADPQAALRALKLRRRLYEQEKRDPGLLVILDSAIALLETTGNLDGLSPGDYATLLAHTCTSGSESMFE